MKMIHAVISPSKLSDVKQALFDSGFGKMTVYPVSGSSQMTHYPDIRYSHDYEPNLMAQMKIEIAANDDCVAPIIEIIRHTAKHRIVGSGKIFVFDIEECIKIRTGEEGDSAI
jgi:nitrogen regulatory protein PII